MHWHTSQAKTRLCVVLPLWLRGATSGLLCLVVCASGGGGSLCLRGLAGVASEVVLCGPRAELCEENEAAFVAIALLELGGGLLRAQGQPDDLAALGSQAKRSVSEALLCV